MDELGHILREARETKGLSLNEVQAQIRINTRFLEALESGEYERLPTPVHVRGFLRNYARFLGLDPQPLLERYELNRQRRSPFVAPNGRSTSQENGYSPPNSDQTFFNPVNVEVGGSQRNPESMLRLVIIVALVIAIGLVVNRFVPLFMGNGDGSEAITEGITEALQNIMRNGDAEPMAGSDSDADAGGFFAPGDPITSTSRNNPDENLPEIPSTRPPLPATMDVINLRLEITERTWMEVTIDGDVRFSGIARANDVFEWQANREAKVLTGNAVGVFVTINDVALGRLGARGENKEEIWRTTN